MIVSIKIKKVYAFPDEFHSSQDTPTRDSSFIQSPASSSWDKRHTFFSKMKLEMMNSRVQSLCSIIVKCHSEKVNYGMRNLCIRDEKGKALHIYMEKYAIQSA